jgi:hypothetical protein
MIIIFNINNCPRMENVIEYIEKNYQLSGCEYFLQEDDDYETSEILLDETVKKLKAHFKEAVEITETNTYDSRTSVSIKFSYKENLGELTATYDSRGYDYWCIDFTNCDFLE